MAFSFAPLDGTFGFPYGRRRAGPRRPSAA